MCLCELATLYTANAQGPQVTYHYHTCLPACVPQGSAIPVSLALEGLLSLVPCRLALSSSLRVDGRDVSLELGQTCRPPRLSGTLAHSFPGLASLGLAPRTTVEASASDGEDSGQAGAFLIKVGDSCSVRATGTADAKGMRRWHWAAESQCPSLQVELWIPLVLNVNSDQVNL